MKTRHETNQEAVKQLAEKIKSAGYDCYIAERGDYGFFTSEDKTKVISFQIDYWFFNFSTNHKGKNIGTGYRITSNEQCEMYNMEWATPEFFKSLLNSPPYKSRRKNEVFQKWTSLDEFLGTYQWSSKFSKA